MMKWAVNELRLTPDRTPSAQGVQQRLECIQLVLGKPFGLSTRQQIQRAGDAVQRLYEAGYLALSASPSPAEAQEAVEARLERIRVRWSQAGLTSFSQDHADVAWLLSLALSASPAPPVGAEQWRPIGDAAKSERPVLLGAELPDGTWAYDVGHWATEEERRIQVGDCGGPCRCPEYDLDEPYWVGWSHEGVQPTHYRPLPPPPARRGGE